MQPTYPAQEPTFALPGAIPYPLSRKGFHSAHFMLWFIFWFLTITVSLGLAWDRLYHTTHVFDTFFSPPHLFVYSMVTISGLLTASVVFNPTLRTWFGPTIRFFPFPFPLPASLLILGAGFVNLLLAGVLDSIWHSNFGLDETGWSTPHAMIAWALLVIYLGFVSCYLALRPAKPTTSFAQFTDVLSIAVLMYFALNYSFAPFNGPLGENLSLDTVFATSRFPILLAQPAAQHTYRIYLAWNIDRSNVIFAVLCALWGGAVLAFIRRLDRRVLLGLVVVAAYYLLQAGAHKELYALSAYVHVPIIRLATIIMPIPLIVAAVIVAILIALRVNEWVAWAVGGIVFGLLLTAIWSPGSPALVIALVAGGTMAVGAWLGAGAYAAVAQPAQRGRAAIILVGVAVPLVTGMVDLFLRFNTP